MTSFSFPTVRRFGSFTQYLFGIEKVSMWDTICPISHVTILAKDITIY